MEKTLQFTYIQGVYILKKYNFHFEKIIRKEEWKIEWIKTLARSAYQKTIVKQNNDSYL